LPGADSTRWTIIRAAASGSIPDRDEFARRYASVIRAYLAARWRGRPLVNEIDDAAQDVFVECFRKDGPLRRADPDAPGGFRAYLWGIVRNVARMVEKRCQCQRERAAGSEFDFATVEADDAPLADAFDRAWAASLLRQAGERQARKAEGDPRATTRVELLRLRFVLDKPIREIAKLWGTDAAHVHEEYRKARREFLAALREVVGEHQGGPPDEVDAQCARLLDHLP
jgi:RNA polymerase sigma factor (sigma-70 family)